MIKALIGYNGFVGSNLRQQTEFQYVYNSVNIREAVGKKFDLAVCAAPSATKWLANKNPGEDLLKTKEFIESIKLIKADLFVQISTVDVYQHPHEVDEETPVDKKSTQPYGLHRYLIEAEVRKHFRQSLIIRLPGLFGEGLKKNFIYDLIHRQPRFINRKKFEEICKRLQSEMKDVFVSAYCPTENGMYSLREDLKKNKLSELSAVLNQVDFSSLFFTDSESIYQFYNLAYLWTDIQLAIANKLSLVNFATAPLSAREIARQCCSLEFANRAETPPVRYNIKSGFAHIFGGKDGYLYNERAVMQQLHDFIREAEGKE